VKAGGRSEADALAAQRPEKKFSALAAIYRAHEQAVQPFTQDAICRPGCSFCCTHYGRLDATTLEGLAIRRRLALFNGRQQVRLRDRIRRNRIEKEAGKASVCPFLDNDGRCRIYEVRPFSCRQLYSLKPCRDSGPTVHRQAVALARQAVRTIQRLDDTGYSGHLTFLLALLEDRRFRCLYSGGGFDPAGIEVFGKAHGLTINCRVGASDNNAETR